MRPILIAASASQSRHCIADVLTRTGYEIVQADSGLAAVEVAPTLVPGLILMAIVMPELNGLQTAARLRTFVDLKHVPIILLGALPPLGIHDEPLASLVNGYLSVDASTDEVLACVSKQYVQG